jgi:integrase
VPFDIEEYVRGGEPGMVRRAEAWQTVIGLQAVDGLTVSGFLLDTAREHVEGTITIDEAQRRIQSRYERRDVGDASDGEPTPHTLRHGMDSDGGWLVARMSHG